MTSEHNTSMEMYDAIITTEDYRQQSFKHQAGRLYTALLLALLIHMLMLQSPLPQASEHPPKTRPISILEVEFANTVQVSKPQPRKASSPQAIQQDKPIIHPEPKKVIHPITQPGKKAVKLTRKKRQKPEKKTIKKPQHRPKKESRTSTSTSAPAVPAAHANTTLKTTPAPSAPATPPVNIAARQQYIQSILGHINHHKHYPYSARRRHMEDDVRVSLVVHADGHVSNIQIQGKHRVLTRATRQAIQDAQPFAAPPTGQEILISWIMRYRLNP